MAGLVSLLSDPLWVRTGSATTGSVLATNEATVAITFDVAFPDAVDASDIRLSASVELDEGGESLRVRRVRSVTRTGCTVNVVNNALTPKTGTVHVIAVKV